MNKPRLDDAEFSDAMIRVQTQNPLLSETALMGALGYARRAAEERSKNSELIADARERCRALREKAWVEKGIVGLTSAPFNSALYIWMTRNICGWRDERELDDDRERATPLKVAPDTIRQMLAIARGGTEGAADA